MTALVPGRFTTAAIRIDGGELEVRLSDGGHWQVKAKLVQEGDWRSLCRGHIDGSIFDTAKADRQVPVRVGPLLVDFAGRRVEVRGARCALRRASSNWWRCSRPSLIGSSRSRS
jgi:hypothetical protein